MNTVPLRLVPLKCILNVSVIKNFTLQVTCHELGTHVMMGLVHVY